MSNFWGLWSRYVNRSYSVKGFTMTLLGVGGGGGVRGLLVSPKP